MTPSVNSGHTHQCFLKFILRAQINRSFHRPAHYYSVFAHEITHSTGNKNRLDRHMTGRFLVVEAFLYAIRKPIRKPA